MESIFVGFLLIVGGYALGYKNGYDAVQRDMEKIIKRVTGRR